VGSSLIIKNYLKSLNFKNTQKIKKFFQIKKNQYFQFFPNLGKFWELDSDHDMVISREDMQRHCNGALTERIIERIFSTAVVRVPAG
jgi:hypothetical protein